VINRTEKHAVAEIKSLHNADPCVGTLLLVGEVFDGSCGTGTLGEGGKHVALIDLINPSGLKVMHEPEAVSGKAVQEEQLESLPQKEPWN
jgi:hypothetical protein